MKTSFPLLLTWVCLAVFGFSSSLKAEGPPTRRASERIRSDCMPAVSSTDLNINQVRARLYAAGSLFQDPSEVGPAFVTPKVAASETAAGTNLMSAIWIGGLDDAGNLKVAAARFGGTDYAPGPLTPDEGLTDADNCRNWDRFFKVRGENVHKHLEAYQAAVTSGAAYMESDLPEDIKGWPARGNPFFESVHGFALPNSIQGLAPFFDRQGDDVYNPLEGDYPIIDQIGCSELLIADEMIWSVYNDAGREHTLSGGTPIRAEVQAISYAFTGNPRLEYATFHAYKLINRAITAIDDVHIGYWMHPLMGCAEDDRFGFDSLRQMVYFYNEDAIDGDENCECQNDQNASYCEHTPLFGVDLLRGPRNEFFEELGFSSFTYHYNGDIFQTPAGLQRPQNPVEYYRCLKGKWRDGTSLTYGGNGYDPTSPLSVSYAYDGPPNSSSDWSMCTAPTNSLDKSCLASFGPFRLNPGAVNQWLLGATWVSDIEHPCPDIRPLVESDEYIQYEFDKCFTQFEQGPDAPDVVFTESTSVIQASLSNEQFSNNAFEDYKGTDVHLSSFYPIDDQLYQFEGYKLFQLSGPDVRLSELDDPEKARLFAQSDIENDIEDIYNWEYTYAPKQDPYEEQYDWQAVLKVKGGNQGLRRQIDITEDLFATDYRPLLNGKTYYYTAVAYAYNEYAPFEHRMSYVAGQQRPYWQGRGNVRVYEVTPSQFPRRVPEEPPRIYPNPYFISAAGSTSEIKIDNLPEGGMLNVYASDGRLVGEWMVSIAGSVSFKLEDVEGRSLTPGVYFIKVSLEGERKALLRWMVH